VWRCFIRTLVSRSTSQDLLRSAGGVLLGAGAIVLLARKSGHGWSSFALMVTVLIPAALLYVLAVRDPGEADGRTAAPAQSVLAVTAVLLWAVALVTFLDWIGASTTRTLNLAAVFAVTGLLGAYATVRAHVAYTALLAGVALAIAWLLVWSKILNHPSPDTFRWLLLGAAAVLLVGSLALALVNARGSGELAITGGLAAVVAGVFGVIFGAFTGFITSVSSSTSSSGAQSTYRAVQKIGGQQHLGWDIYLVVVSLVLVSVGARMRVRGLGYVGALGVGAFVISVGAQITRIETGSGPTHDVLAWPLVLLALGALGLIASAIRRPQDSQ
jgi:hypothetical protein